MPFVVADSDDNTPIAIQNAFMDSAEQTAVDNRHGKVKALSDQSTGPNEDTQRLQQDISQSLSSVTVNDLFQHVNLMQYVTSRILRLEQDIEDVKDGATGSSSRHRHLQENQLPPTTSELRYVNWSEFKNRYTKAKELPAIEILQGSAKYFWQPDIGLARRGFRPRNHALCADILSSSVPIKTSSLQAHEELPERMRINSWSLLLILSQLVSEKWRLDSKVLRRPFKILFQYEEEIKNILARLEEVWKDAETQEPVSNDISGIRFVAHCFCKTCREFNSEPLIESFVALQDLQTLYSFIESVLLPYKEKIRSPETSWIYFSDLWLVFQPGDHAVNASPHDIRDAAPQIIGQPIEQEILRVHKTWGGRAILDTIHRREPSSPSEDVPIEDFGLAMYYLDFNGKSYNAYFFEVCIKAFDGMKELTSSGFFPLRSRKDAQLYEEGLRKRGELFRDLAGRPQHRDYLGYSIAQPATGESSLLESKPRPPEYIDSEVMIDFDTALEWNSDWIPRSDSFESHNPTNPQQESFLLELTYWQDHERRQISWKVPDNIFDDHCVDTTMAEKFVDSDHFFVHRLEGKPFPLGEHDYMLLPGRVFGFVFRTRRWAQMRIQNLRRVSWEEKPMDSLQLTAGHCEILQALIQSHLDSKAIRNTIREDEQEEENDFVRGKGLGLIVLLHGAPGTGKTSTAECIAMANHKPLFPITCGDLGLTPKAVEAELEQKFHLAQLWDCVLLLDEADVFLARRTQQDLERNALVSVFLRTLEYYTGILFLTTNRAGSLDEAFKSRVHLALFYPPLTLKQTKCIWTDHIKRLDRRKKRPITMNQDQLVKFGREHYKSLENEKHKRWNGRQIRNAFQTAVAIAEYETVDMRQKGYTGNPELKVQHLETIVRTSSEFDEYMRKTHSGRTDEQIAAMANLRSAAFEADYLPEPSNLAAQYGSTHPSQRDQWMQSGSNVGFRSRTGFHGGGGGNDNGYLANLAPQFNPNTQNWDPSQQAPRSGGSLDPAQHIQPKRPDSTPQKARHDDDDDDDSDSE